jgi:hypothetical protein
MDELVAKRTDRGKLDEKHVFICGLARAGTTVLMRSFYSTGKFRSLTYRDMPFVLMPRLWKRFFKIFHMHGESEERAHGDGIQVDFDSPEAFEEVFWRTFSGNEYIFEKSLRPYEVQEDISDQFHSYVQNIVDSADDVNQTRYLSKNNNNILRLNSIRTEFPNAVILIPFREPRQHAFSLLQQHLNFCKRGATDAFSVKYMEWLGHYEFGVGHKPFAFEADFSRSCCEHDAKKIDYWLNIWISTYEYLLLTAPYRSVFVSFEVLCRAPEATLLHLFEIADVEVSDQRFDNSIRLPKQHSVAGIDAQLIARAEETYKRLCERASY